jgi:glutathione S-transferase
MIEYVEAAYPQTPLLPADPLAAARVRELIQFIELHLELVARELFSEAFFGGKVSEETKTRVQKVLKRHAAAFGRFARFDRYIAGPEFTMADCAAAFHLPMVSQATKAIYGEDMLAAYPVREYVQFLLERPTMKKVNEERKAGAIALMEYLAKK